MSSLRVHSNDREDQAHGTADLVLAIRLGERRLAAAEVRWRRHAPSHAVLRRFFVEREMRGRGVGLRLVAAVVEACRERGIVSLAASVHQALVGVCRLMGFVPLGEGRDLDGRVYVPMVLLLDDLEATMRDRRQAPEAALAIARLGGAHDLAVDGPAADAHERLGPEAIAV